MTTPTILKNVTVATMERGYGVQTGASIALDAGRVAWVGPSTAVPEQFAKAEAIDLEGRLVTPSLIDCHTHLVHGGNRTREFELRLEGASYEDIARAGGGIVSTVAATRQTAEDVLLEQALRRVDALTAEGVTTVEIKSGYGLDQETELKMLRVARRVAEHRPIRVKTTFLGAHAVPEGITADAYIDEICIPALRAAHDAGLVDAVDGFCEGIAFRPDQIARVFDTAQDLGLPVKLHSDQLSNMGGTQLAARYGALSVDHVEYTADNDVVEMAGAGSVAVLLPGAFYTLHETQKPPIALFRDNDVPMAVATDLNPGSSPLGSLLLAMNMSCTLFGLTPTEALQGTTVHAARALGLADCGRIEPGLRADLAVWDVESPAELSYRIGVNLLHSRYFEGKVDL